MAQDIVSAQSFSVFSWYMNSKQTASFTLWFNAFALFVCYMFSWYSVERCEWCLLQTFSLIFFIIKILLKSHTCRNSLAVHWVHGSWSVDVCMCVCVCTPGKLNATQHNWTFTARLCWNEMQLIVKSILNLILWHNWKLCAIMWVSIHTHTAIYPGHYG